MEKENTEEKIRTWAGMSFVRIPKGKFIMGSKEDNELAWGDEKPQHKLELPYDYWVGRFPVSVADFFGPYPWWVSRSHLRGWPFFLIGYLKRLKGLKPAFSVHGKDG